ncbi:amino acid permease [Novymonas esmeraldas]|uniref:Amino acid permease n=1 Tax=Novymonas esmeraldas TaxID=1808958 RepID=A0AAW0ERV1_9TRYP
MRHARERGAASGGSDAGNSGPSLGPTKVKDVSSPSLGCDEGQAPCEKGIARRHVEVMFHPGMRRTREVIRRPEWVRRAGEGVAHRGSLSTIALFGIMFANCVGGGYGFEDGIGSAGPLITLIVCAILPWMWAFPTGLAVAELSTAVPSNSGVLMWTNAAFPPFVSVMCILATIFITFIGNATYPNLTAEYAQKLGHLSAGPVAGVKIGVVALCCILNCVGVEIVGGSSIILCSITILPFALLTLIQLFSAGFNSAVLYVDVKTVKWADFFSIISWNYANIENAGAVVEEVANPRRAFPKAMVMLMFSTYVGYVMPMLAGVSAMGVGQDYSEWEAGHWPDVAKKIAGDWLKYMLFAGALLSGVGFTLTSMCCTSRLLAGMGTMHMFPAKVSRVIGYYHPRLGTPIPAIVLNAVVTLVFSVSMDFTSVVSLCQSVYCLRMLLIYAALLKLRVDYPNLPRPYALPFNTWKTAVVLLPAAAFSLMASIVSAMTSLAIGMALVGFVVGGSALSWLYCRVFARNGFQGVIVECEVSSGDDVDGGGGEGGGGGAGGGDGGDGALGEGVFYADDEPNNGEPVDDLLLGILPMPAAASAPRTGPGRAPRDVDGAALLEMEYTTHDGATAEATFLSNSAAACPPGSGTGGRSPVCSFPPYGAASATGSTMRHRRRTRSPGAGGGSGATAATATSTYGHAISGDESGEEAEVSAMERSGGGGGPPAQLLSTSPPPQLQMGSYAYNGFAGASAAAGSRNGSRRSSPPSGRRSPTSTSAVHAGGTTWKAAPPSVP